MVSTMIRDDDAHDAEVGLAPSADDVSMIEALRRGDEDAFARLLDQYHATMLRLARLYVADPSVAEEVVQEAWMGVLQGVQRFEARSSLKTWIFRILTNCAKTRGQRESRCMAFSTVWGEEAGPLEPAVDPERFRASDPWQGHWISAPHSWDDLPEDRFLSAETQARLHATIATLPTNQQEVIRLRDVEGWASDEVCRVLEISEANQRVLLHRARSKVRLALEQYFAQEASVPV